MIRKCGPDASYRRREGESRTPPHLMQESYVFYAKQGPPNGAKRQGVCVGVIDFPGRGGRRASFPLYETKENAFPPRRSRQRIRISRQFKEMKECCHPAPSSGVLLFLGRSLTLLQSLPL